MADGERSTPATGAKTPVYTERRADFNRRLRAAFIEGAEQDSLQRLERGMTAQELERLLARYPRDT